jgi:uncharacterized membrane protein
MKPAPLSTVQTNLRTIADLERTDEARRGLIDRIADLIANFSGTMLFVGIHVLWFTLWFLINTGVLPIAPKFDPYPFILLAMIVSVEGVLLSTFVLMKQNRMQRKSDARDHLNLQIDLLAEKEVTKTLQLLRAICRRLDIPETDYDLELDEMTSTTSVDLIATQIHQALPED